MTLNKFTLVEKHGGDQMVESRRGPFCLVSDAEREISAARAEGEKIGLTRAIALALSLPGRRTAQSAVYLAAIDQVVMQLEDAIARSEQQAGR